MRAVLLTVRAEWFRVWRKKRLYLLAGLYWLLLPALALLIARAVNANLRGAFADQGGGAEALLQALASPFGLARVMLTAPALMSPSFYLICVTLIAAVLIGDERSHGMWKNVLVVQPSRWAVLTGKALTAMLCLGVLLLGACLAGALFGLLGGSLLSVSATGGEWGALIPLYLAQWAFLVTPVLLAFLLIFLVRSGVMGVVLVLFLPSLLEGVYSLINLLLALRPFNAINALLQALKLRSVWDALPRYFLTTNLYAPARSSARSALGALGGDAALGAGGMEQLLGSPMGLPHAAAVTSVYAALFALLLYWLFAGRDVE